MGTSDDSPHTLAPGRFGPAAVLVAALGAAAPLAASITLVPAAYARGGGPLVPLSLGAVAVVLLLFTAGYAALAHRAPFAGALYAYVSRGLGRPSGVGAAWVALLSYTALQLGLYGAAGETATPLLHSWFGVSLPWWAVAAICWAIVAICGTWRISIVMGVLAALVVAEAAVVAGYAAADVIDPSAGRIAPGSIVPAHPQAIDRPVLGILLVLAVLAYAGFETAGVYAEETHRPRRDVGRATYGVVLCFGVLLTGSAWAVAVAAGPSVGLLAQDRGSELLFDLAASRLAPWAITLGRAVLLLGLLAAMIALHQSITRYLYALGREQIFPRGLGRAARRTSAPRAASITQSVIAAIAIAAAYLSGIGDPAVLAHRLSVLGGLGILVLLLATSLSALLHLNRVPNGDSTWSRFVAPALATVGLGVLCYLAFRDLPALLDVRTGNRLIWIVPAALGAVALVGALHAAMLRAARPVVYAGIGRGGVPVVVTPHIPDPREPGAHRPERVNG